MHQPVMQPSSSAIDSNSILLVITFVLLIFTVISPFHPSFHRLSFLISFSLLSAIKIKPSTILHTVSPISAVSIVINLYFACYHCSLTSRTVLPSFLLLYLQTRIPSGRLSRLWAGGRGCSEKKFPHTDTRHPDWLSRASQHVRGATKNVNMTKVCSIETTRNVIEVLSG